MTLRLPDRFLVVLVATIIQTTSVQAESRFNFSGFGTLGYAATDKKDVSYFTQEAGEGIDADGGIKLDTRLGVQLDTVVDDTTSATVQVLSRQSYDGEFDPRIEWAFLRSQVSDSLVFRVGRLGVPFFMISDFREVGYANTTLRPPEDTYKLAPLGSYDGIDLTGYYELGETEVTAQAFVGYRDQEGRDGAAISLRDATGGNIAFERGPARLRLSYIQTRLGVSAPDGTGGPIEDILNQATVLAPELSIAAEEFNGHRKKTTFFGVGIELDFDPWNFTAEYTQRRLNKSFLASYDAWYVTAAYRWGNFTPYITLSQLTQTSRSELKFASMPLLDPLEEFIRFTYYLEDQSSVIAGLRWDFWDGAALKFQAENISRKEIGASFGQPNDLPRGTDVKLYSLTVDFTF